MPRSGFYARENSETSSRKFIHLPCRLARSASKLVYAIVRMPSDTNAFSTDFSDRQKSETNDEMVDQDTNEWNNNSQSKN